jgi:tRNA modification GTPase
LLRRLYAVGARPARAGEFTLRAFLAGRLDLLQAEGVLGVIDADDHVQLRTALDQLAGGLSGRIAALREQLLLHLADLEAGLDFVEEDIEFVSREGLRQRLVDAVSMLRELSTQAERRLQSSGRRQVVLAGLANAGKSALFNCLADRAAAIVSPVRGTTRDALCCDLDCDHIGITLWDTAGWEDGVSSLAAAADDVRRDRLDRADLVIWCTAADLSPADQRLDDALREQQLSATTWLHVVTKSDLRGSLTGFSADKALAVCAATGAGLGSLRIAIAEALRGTAAHQGELLGSTAARCRESLRQASESLAAALAALESGAGDELLAIDLRSGLNALGLICGAVYTDDILDRIFCRFCIGK